MAQQVTLKQVRHMRKLQSLTRCAMSFSEPQCSRQQGADASSSTHDPQVGTVTLRLQDPLALDGAKRWLDSLLWEGVDVMDIFRMKGVFSFQGDSRKHILQVQPETLLPCAL